MKIGIATYWNPDYDDICAITNPNKQGYADRNRYWTNLRRQSGVPYHDVFFKRYGFFRDALKDVDWLVCCDGDLIFTNLTKRVEDIVKPEDTFIIAKDALMIQAGIFLVRNCELGRTILKGVEQVQRPFNRIPDQADQPALQTILTKLAGQAVRYVPQRVLQSYEYGLYKDLGGNYAKALDVDGNDGQWRVGDFSLHVPGVRDKKVQVLTDHLPLVVR